MLKLLLLLVGMALAWFLWRFIVRGDALIWVRPGAPAIRAMVSRVEPGQALVIAIEHPGQTQRLVEISLPRALSARLGLSPPPGFRPESLPLTPAEQADPAMVEFARQYNDEQLRWVGSLELSVGDSTELVLPMQAQALDAGQLRLQLEAGGRWGGIRTAIPVSLTPEPIAD